MPFDGPNAIKEQKQRHQHRPPRAEHLPIDSES